MNVCVHTWTYTDTCIKVWVCTHTDTCLNICVHTWTYTDTCMKVCEHTQLPIWMCKGAHTWTQPDTRYLPECMSVHTHKHTDNLWDKHHAFSFTAPEFPGGFGCRVNTSFYWNQNWLLPEHGRIRLRRKWLCQVQEDQGVMWWHKLRALSSVFPVSLWGRNGQDCQGRLKKGLRLPGLRMDTIDKEFLYWTPIISEENGSICSNSHSGCQLKGTHCFTGNI